jgi:hypothetical protein
MEHPQQNKGNHLLTNLRKDAYSVLKDVAQEVERQRAEHGPSWDDGHSPNDWIALMMKYGTKKLGNRDIDFADLEQIALIRKNFKIVAAISVSAMMAMDRRVDDIINATKQPVEEHLQY